MDGRVGRFYALFVRVIVDFLKAEPRFIIGGFSFLAQQRSDDFFRFLKV
jgi:hypothetical protein